MRRIKVLLIDDEEDFCRGLKLTLEETKKFDVFTATRGNTGLNLAKAEKPDVILLDIVMPGITGAEVAEALHGDSETNKIPIIFLTVVLRKSEESAFGGSASKYRVIAKPVKIDNLIQRIKEVVAV